MVVNKPLKRWPASLIWELQIKIIRFHCIPIKVAKIQDIGDMKCL